jgi:antitoxin component YwqK of YwqJK toxin-antitoxin module
MYILRIIFFSLVSLGNLAITAQTGQTINQTDNQGKKQGHWIRKYPNGNIMYDGFFRDDKPAGEFKRYYEDKKLKSVLVFNKTGDEAEATLYYPNGFVASKGRYVNQLKEGTWQFFSSTTGNLRISEANYSKDKRHGLSVNYYPDSTIAEKVNYSNGLKHGEWIKYYPDGTITFRTTCLNGKLHGKFEAFFENGKPEFSGFYKNDVRDGSWMIYKKDGSLRFKTVYTLGMPDNREMEIYETNYLDSLDLNKAKIPDPEKTGNIW